MGNGGGGTLLDLDVIKKAYRDYVVSNPGGLAGNIVAGGIDQSQIKSMCEDFKAILFACIKDVIPSFDANGIVYGNAEAQADGLMRVEFSFTAESIHRESLAPEAWPNGTDPYGGIVLMFHMGWSAKGRVRGEWEGHGSGPIWSLQSRDSNPFLQRAIDQFIRTYGSDSIKAELIGDYGSGSGQKGGIN